MNIYEKLNNIQTELKAPKGQLNTFANYRFRSCEDILEAVKPFLSATKTALTLNDQIVLIGERYYVQATAILYDCEVEDSKICNISYAREEESKKGSDQSQVTGASSSYARKYALNGLFAIDDTKDSDATNTHGKDADTQADIPKTERVDTERRITPVEAQAVKDLAENVGANVKEMLTYYKVDSLDDLKLAQWVHATKQLEKKRT